jgi:hypothetical protein
MNVRGFRSKLTIWASVIAVLVVCMFVLSPVSEAAQQQASPLSPLMTGSFLSSSQYYDRADTQIAVGAGGAGAIALTIKALDLDLLPAAVIGYVAQTSVDKLSEYLTDNQGECLKVSTVLGLWITMGAYPCDNPPADAKPLYPSAPAIGSTPQPIPPSSVSTPSSQPATPAPVTPEPVGQVDPPDTATNTQPPGGDVGGGFSPTGGAAEQAQSGNGTLSPTPDGTEVPPGSNAPCGYTTNPDGSTTAGTCAGISNPAPNPNPGPPATGDPCNGDVNSCGF